LVSEDLIGFIGGTIVACSFLPQIVRVIKLKRAYEISPFFTFLMLVGCIIWTVYGFSIKMLPTMIFSLINTMQVALLMFLRYMYGRAQPKKVISSQITSDIAYTAPLEADHQWLEETEQKIDKILN
jgi:MtN3 and saliva related transmembrane protein